MTFQVAATLSRVAEAEWLRTTEGIRRFSPLIGQLGEWKALCEGGWTGPVPGDLPDVDQTPEPPQPTQDAILNARELGQSRALHLKTFVTEFCGHSGFASSSPRPLPVPDPSRAVSLKPPPAAYDDGSMRSITSLGSFPEPPNHFPIPPLAGDFSSNSETSSPIVQYNSSTSQGDGQVQSRTSSDKSRSSSDPSVALPRVTESPMEETIIAPALTNGSSLPELPQDHLVTLVTAPALIENSEIFAAAAHRGPNSGEPEVKVASSPPAPNTELLQSSPPAASVSAPQLLPIPGTQSHQRPEPAPPVNSRSSSSTGVSSTFKRGDYLDNREFGVDSSAEAMQLRAKTLDSAQERVERSDTSKSNGGMVAAIRDKYTRAVSSYLPFSVRATP